MKEKCVILWSLWQSSMWGKKGFGSRSEKKKKKKWRKERKRKKKKSGCQLGNKPLDCAASVERAVGEEVGDTMAVEQLKPLKEEVHRQLYPQQDWCKFHHFHTIQRFPRSTEFLLLRERRTKREVSRKKRKKKEEKLTLARVGNGTPYPVII